MERAEVSDQCVHQRLIINASPVAIRDIDADSRIPHDAYRPTFVKSLLMVPIGEKNPVGAIGNYWSRTTAGSKVSVKAAAAVLRSWSLS